MLARSDEAISVIVLALQISCSLSYMLGKWPHVKDLAARAQLNDRRASR